MNYWSNKITYKLEFALSIPFVLIGKIFAIFSNLKGNYSTIIFSPNGDIGGSIKVNSDLLSCFEGKTLVIFTKKQKNNLYINRFKKTNAHIIDISQYIDNKYLHIINLIFRGIIVSWIKKNNIKNIVGGECIYFYKIIPHLSNKYNKIEICHVDNWLNYSVRFIEDISYRVFSTNYLKNKVIEQYNKFKIPSHFYKKLIHIENSIQIPDKYIQKEQNKIQVYFIGRGTKQKRADLACSIAREIHKVNNNVEFTFIGDLNNVIKTNDFPFINFLGNINDEQLMQLHYQKADILLMTSQFEGLPLTIMEMMSYGKTIISTGVSAIPDYIKDGENGFLINSKEDNCIIEDGKQKIINLIENPLKLRKFGEINREFAVTNFDKKYFCLNYSKLLDYR